MKIRLSLPLTCGIISFRSHIQNNFRMNKPVVVVLPSLFFATVSPFVRFFDFSSPTGGVLFRPALPLCIGAHGMHR